jgi:phage gp29-like protein
MFPPQELALLAADGLLLGVGVGELLPVEGRDFPVFQRLDPAGLRFRWAENRWYYATIAGEIPITPGDGRWVLHCPGGRNAPWQNGLWKCVGKNYIRKEHAQLHKDNWEAKLANPARVAVAPSGATEKDHDAWFQKVMAWGINTVFGLKPGWDVKILESNGRGAESFRNTTKDCNEEFIVAVAGQTVTTDGGTGFANADVHKSIRADLIKSTADALAHTLNTQGIPVYVVTVYGEEAIGRSPTVSWDVRPPRDMVAEAQTMLTVAQAITQMVDALEKAKAGASLDVAAICSKYGIPILADVDGDGVPDTSKGPEARLRVVGRA